MRVFDLPLTFAAVQIPTENDDETRYQRNDKQRRDVVIMLFRVLEIKNLHPRVNYQIGEPHGEQWINNSPRFR